MKKISQLILPHPMLTLVLWVMWLAINNTLAPGQVVLGLMVAMLIPHFTTNFWSRKLVNPKQIPLVLRFMVLMTGDIIVANITVAKLILGKNKNLKPVFFEVPLSAKNPYAITLLANCITLTPGTVSCKISNNFSQIIVHGLNIDDPQKEIDLIKNRYEKPIIKMFAEDVLEV